jgi:hypothetical protein
MSSVHSVTHVLGSYHYVEWNAGETQKEDDGDELLRR